MITKAYKTICVVAAGLMVATAAHGAAYLKLDGVEGSTQQVPAEQHSGADKLNHDDSTQRGLLLPAVQKAQEADDRANQGTAGRIGKDRSIARPASKRTAQE